jgi:hypothetical protein
MRLRIILPALLMAGTTTQAMADIGRIKLVSGAATVLRGDQTLAATSGLVLEKGDTLVTGKNGRVGVTFNDNSRFAAGPNSRLSVADYAFDDTTHVGKFLARVDKGAVAIVSGLIAKSGKDAMRVATPTSLLGVRGTRFVVEVN